MGASSRKRSNPRGKASMVQHQLSPNQQRKVDEITELLKAVSHVRTLVTELESSRAAKTTIVANLCSSIARELSQMRQRLLTAPIGTVADIAGALAIMAGRTGGLHIELPRLTDGRDRLRHPPH